MFISFFRKPKNSKLRNFKFRKTGIFILKLEISKISKYWFRNQETVTFLTFRTCEIMEKNNEDGVEKQLHEDSCVGMNTCYNCALEFVLTLLSAGGDDMSASAGISEVTDGVMTPEIAFEDEVKPAEKACTILDWVEEHYRPPPPHPSTLEVFHLFNTEYIPSFEVDPVEVPVFNIGRRTDDLRFEIFVFSN